jgi:general stress protein YciG
MDTAASGIKRRGFASLSPERRREIASKGGTTVHQKGLGHQWTSEEARTAGKLGGTRSAAKKRVVA